MSAALSTFAYEVSYWIVFFVYVIGFRLRAAGLQRIPRRGPVLIIANHQSLLDPIAVGLGFRRHIHYLARKTLFGNPIFGWWLRLVKCVPIDQDGVGKEGIRKILEQLQRGNPVLVFPEGNRSDDGRLHPLKPGIALLVGRAHVPILPVGVSGAFDAWPRQRRLPRFSPLFLRDSRRSIAAVYGHARDPATLKGLSREEVLEILHRDLTDVVAQADALNASRRSR